MLIISSLKQSATWYSVWEPIFFLLRNSVPLLYWVLTMADILSCITAPYWGEFTRNMFHCSLLSISGHCKKTQWAIFYPNILIDQIYHIIISAHVVQCQQVDSRWDYKHLARTWPWSQNMENNAFSFFGWCFCQKAFFSQPDLLTLPLPWLASTVLASPW